MVLHKRSKITALTVENLKQWQIKIKKLESGQYTFCNCYIQGASRKKQHHCFFCRAPKLLRKNDFYASTLDKYCQMKEKLDQGTF